MTSMVHKICNSYSTVKFDIFPMNYRGLKVIFPFLEKLDKILFRCRIQLYYPVLPMPSYISERTDSKKGDHISRT